MDELYKMIFKRKSVRKYSDDLKISDTELEDINKKIKELVPLVDSIKVKCVIAPREETTSKRGEYCLLIYSEEKDNYLLNVGYMFEQLDLYLASKNIGVCWYGLGKVKADYKEKLKYVIMLTLGKVTDDDFRKDYTEAKRNDTHDAWTGEHIDDIAEMAKYAPSACNSQPWKVICEKDTLKVYRSNKSKSLIPKRFLSYYNYIDIGIYLYFLELVMSHNKIEFKRMLVANAEDSDMLPVATYELK
ncbi:MAG: nitroreductase [Clostridiales bacterium]|nr:nitroreductase [Clostridiales bacterium]